MASVPVFRGWQVSVADAQGSLRQTQPVAAIRQALGGRRSRQCSMNIVSWLRGPWFWRGRTRGNRIRLWDPDSNGTGVSRWPAAGGMVAWLPATERHEFRRDGASAGHFGWALDGPEGPHRLHRRAC